MVPQMSRKERPTTQIGTFIPQLASYKVPNKHTPRHNSKHSGTPFHDSPDLEKRPSRDEPKLYLSDSVYKDGNKIMGSRRTRTEHGIGVYPRVTYHEFMVLDQAGSANIGCDNTKERNLVAIKRLKRVDKSSARRIRPISSDYVVNIRETYFDNDDLVIIYEQMDVSLRHITSILKGPLKPFEIAVICNELVAGLYYIHEELCLHYGELSCGTILLNLDGMVKIANIGESFVRNKYITAESRRDDVRSIGFVMMELMEPMTYILNPHSTELESPEKWRGDSAIKNFLSATQDQSLEELKSHDFLPKEKLGKCLRAWIFCAIWAAATQWDILSLP